MEQTCAGLDKRSFLSQWRKVKFNMMNDPADPMINTQVWLPDPEATISQHFHEETDRSRGSTIANASRQAINCFELPGYRIDSEIARGGMGVVLLGHDLVLNREVAIKILLTEKASPFAADRFIRESQIAAKLAHPGIPPVYALGEMPNGSPFLAMKLIRGQTLLALLKNRHSPKADLPRFLQVFEQICQAVGFAHAGGIVHRDLKPSNVMVGEFGEVQVMDWGLAKIVQDPESNSQQAEQPAGQIQIEPTAVETSVGTILGTPAYMSPEQARGSAVDARTDVFSLGAILCEILTGSTAYGPGTSVDIIRQAAAGNLSRAMERLSSCGTDADLIVLAKHCLEPQPESRPSDARHIATAVAAYRAEVEQRLRHSETQRAMAEATNVEQRKRRNVVMLAAGIIVTVLSAGIIVSLTQRNRALTAESGMAEQLEKTKAAMVQTEAARDQARNRYQVAMAAFNDMIFAIQTKLEAHAGTLELRKELLTGARGGLQKLLRDSEQQNEPDQKLIWAYVQMGTIERILGNLDAARNEFQAAYKLAKRLSDASPKNPEAQRNVSVCLSHLGDDAMTRNEFSAALEFYQQKYQIDHNQCERDPQNSGHRRDLSMSLGRLGEVAMQQGQPREAFRFYKEKHDIVQQLADADPNNVLAQQDLALSYELLGNSAAYLQDPELVLSSYQKMNEINQRLVDAEPNDIARQRTLWVSLTKLGNFHDDAGQSDIAINFYTRGIGLIEALAVADRLNVKTQTELFMAYVNLGTCESIRINFEESAAWFRKGRDVLLPLQEKKLLTGQLQNAVADIDQQLENVDYFAKAVADIDFVLSQPAAHIPSLISLRMQKLIQNSDRNAAAETATRLSTLASSESSLRVAAAHAWNMASSLSTEDETFQSHCVSQAITVLKMIATGEAEPIESPAALAKALLQDPELSRLREHAEFDGFVQSLQAP